MGIVADLLYLNEGQFQELVDKFGDLSKCPGSYLFKHFKVLHILTETDTLSERINLFGLRRGDSFSLQGYTTSPIRMTAKDSFLKYFPVPAGARFKYYLVDNISVKKSDKPALDSPQFQSRRTRKWF